MIDCFSVGSEEGSGSGATTVPVSLLASSTASGIALSTVRTQLAGALSERAISISIEGAFAQSVKKPGSKRRTAASPSVTAILVSPSVPLPMVSSRWARSSAKWKHPTSSEAGSIATRTSAARNACSRRCLKVALRRESPVSSDLCDVR